MIQIKTLMIRDPRIKNIEVDLIMFQAKELSNLLEELCILERFGVP